MVLSTPERREKERLMQIAIEEERKSKERIKEIKYLLTKNKSELTKSERKLMQDILQSEDGQILNSRQLKSSQVKRHGLMTMTDGIDINGYFLDRPKLVQQVMTFFEHSQFVLIIAPPASGKTSLCDLIIESRKALCIYISCIDLASRTNQLLMGIAQDSMGKKFNLNKIKKDCIVMLDDSQIIYHKESFWCSLMIGGQHRFPMNIKFLIVATHNLDSGAQASPIEFEGRPRLGREHLLLNDDEAESFLSAKHIGLPDAMKSPDVINFILKDCAGLIGALELYIESLDRDFRKDVPSSTDLLCYWVTRKFLRSFRRCFGIKSFTKDITKNFRECLSLALFSDEILSEAIAEENEKDFDILQRVGLLLETEDGTYKYTSPLAKRYISKKLHPRRSPSLPQNIDDLVKKVIQTMSSSAIQNSYVNKDSCPKEATFQHMWWNGLLKCTPASVHVCPELSHIYPFAATTYSTQFKKIKGAIDFFVNGKLRWGFELMVSGNKCVGESKRTEHIQRITKGGKYYRLVLNEAVVIDFRCYPSGEFPEKIRAASNLITVLFQDGDFSKCDCKFRLKEDLVTFNLMA